MHFTVLVSIVAVTCSIFVGVYLRYVEVSTTPPTPIQESAEIEISEEYEEFADTPVIAPSFEEYLVPDTELYEGEVVSPKISSKDETFTMAIVSGAPTYANLAGMYALTQFSCEKHCVVITNAKTGALVSAVVADEFEYDLNSTLLIAKSTSSAMYYKVEEQGLRVIGTLIENGIFVLSPECPLQNNIASSVYMPLLFTAPSKCYVPVGFTGDEQTSEA